MAPTNHVMTQTARNGRRLIHIIPRLNLDQSITMANARNVVVTGLPPLAGRPLPHLVRRPSPFGQ